MITRAGAVLILAMGIVTVLNIGCGKKKAQEPPPTTQVPVVPPKVTVKPKEPQNQTIKPGITRLGVLRHLSLSHQLEEQLRKSNKSPTWIRAQLVLYRNEADNSLQEMLEVAVANQTDETTEVTPFYVLMAESSKVELPGEELDGYKIIADVSDEYAGISYPKTTIGAFTMRDSQLDLCSAEYEDTCYFDSQSARPDFSLFAWLKTDIE